MKLYKLAPLGGALLLALAACGCHRLQARDQLNKGVVAFRNAQFQAAIVHFKQAVALDPTLLNARLFLATAYEAQYVPGGDSPDNVKIAEQAIETFEQVLKMDPANTTALPHIGQIYYNMKNFDKAKEYQKRRLELEPNNQEPYYWIGVMDWAICFPRTQQLRKDQHVDAPKDPVNHPDVLPPIPKKALAELADKNGPLVDEGLKALNKAIELKPNDYDTMAYLNLMYRQKAEIESDPDAQKDDIKQAEDWVEKYINAKKAAAGGSASGGTAAQ